MKNQEDLDRMITEALSEKEAELFADLGEQSLLQMVAGLLKSRNRWLIVVTMLVTLAFTIVGFYCGYQFFYAETTEEMIRWAAFFFFSMMAVIGNKLWYWMEMQRNSLSREIKRLELQVAHLSDQIDTNSRAA